MISGVYNGLVGLLGDVGYADLYFSQYLRWEDEPPIGLPAVFIEIASVLPEQVKMAASCGQQYNVNLHVVAENYGDTSNLVLPDHRAAALQRIYGPVDQAMEIMAEDGWQLIQLTTDVRPSNCFATILRYNKLL